MAPAWRHVLSIVADDETTLTLTTDTAYECLPLLLDIPIIKDGSVDEASPLGSGPYVMKATPALSGTPTGGRRPLPSWTSTKFP